MRKDCVYIVIRAVELSLIFVQTKYEQREKGKQEISLTINRGRAGWTFITYAVTLFSFRIFLPHFSDQGLSAVRARLV